MSHLWFSGSTSQQNMTSWNDVTSTAETMIKWSDAQRVTWWIEWSNWSQLVWQRNITNQMEWTVNNAESTNGSVEKLIKKDRIILETLNRLCLVIYGLLTAAKGEWKWLKMHTYTRLKNKDKGLMRGHRMRFLCEGPREWRKKSFSLNKQIRRYVGQFSQTGSW